MAPHPLSYNLHLVASINRFIADADDTQPFLFLSPASLSRSLCSLQRCVYSLPTLFLYNGLVPNPTKTEAICFGTSPRLKSLSNLTFIEAAGTSVPQVDCVKPLVVTFDSHLNLISIFPTSALNPTSIFVPSAIFALFWLRNFQDHRVCYCQFQIRLCQFHS